MWSSAGSACVSWSRLDLQPPAVLNLLSVVSFPPASCIQLCWRAQPPKDRAKVTHIIANDIIMAAVTHCMSVLVSWCHALRNSDSVPHKLFSYDGVSQECMPVSHAVAILMCLNVANLQFECVHVYVTKSFWQLAQFRNCVAQIGGCQIACQFRNCVHVYY